MSILFKLVGPSWRVSCHGLKWPHVQTHSALIETPHTTSPSSLNHSFRVILQCSGAESDSSHQKLTPSIPMLNVLHHTHSPDNLPLCCVHVSIRKKCQRNSSTFNEKALCLIVAFSECRENFREISWTAVLLLLLLEPLLGVHQLRTQDDISLFIVYSVELQILK